MQSDCEDPSGSEDSYADLSGYKEFICPVTKELLLDFEDNQINENLEESLIQTHEAGAKPVMNVCDSRDVCNFQSLISELISYSLLLLLYNR